MKHFGHKNKHRDVKLISSKNRRWLDGKQAELDRRQEVFYNIARRIGLPPSGCFGCTIIYGTVYGVGCLIAGILPLIAIFGDFYAGIRITGNAMFVYLISSLTCIVALLIGRHYLLEVSKRTGKSRQANAYIEQLITAGILIYGEIISSEWARYNDEYPMSGARAIIYQFCPPDSETLIDGEYFTSVVFQDFKKGDKIAILYLNRHIHIVL